MKTLCIALLAVPLAVLAGDEAKKPDFKKLTQTAGTIVCVGCELDKEGADAQCTLHSKHAQGLKDAEGKMWTLVDNVHGHGVITNEKLRGKEVRIHGWTFAKAQYIGVWKYEVKDGDKWVSYAYCTDCGWEKGDNGESELCDDCQGK
ncbi:MAG: hypothetical protein AAB074_05250 [Planctomycetota bacterium]